MINKNLQKPYAVYFDYLYHKGERGRLRINAWGANRGEARERALWALSCSGVVRDPYAKTFYTLLVA